MKNSKRKSGEGNIDDFKSKYYVCRLAIDKGFNNLSFEDMTRIGQAFQAVCDKISNINRDVCLEFSLNGTILFTVKAADNKNIGIVFGVDLKNVASKTLDALLLDRITCLDFLIKNSNLIDKDSIRASDLIKTLSEAGDSWDKFTNRIGYSIDEIIAIDELPSTEKLIRDKNVVWCYNKSCTGKTFLGLRVLQYMNSTKIVYNPATDCSCDLDALKLIIEFGKDCSVLIDDLQCDVELAKLLFSFISNNIQSISARDNHVFLISWTSLAKDQEFSKYSGIFPVVETQPERFINTMKSQIRDQNLLSICQDNLALISTAKKITAQRGKSVADPSLVMFEYFVRTIEEQHLFVIHIMAVLGMYEFETPIRFIKEFGNSDVGQIVANVITAKEIGDSIFLAHRTIAEFIANFIEANHNQGLCSRGEIIRKYINYIDSRKKWKALSHLIGENGQSELLATNKLWNFMYSFQRSIKSQTDIDPSWHDTPSSMYFVVAAADMLGVVDEYACVIDAMCSKFSIKDGHVEVLFDLLQTTHDFEKIQERMIKEDAECEAFNYEHGVSIDRYKMHTNWLYGLMIGVKHNLEEFGHSDLIKLIEGELIQNQSEEGYWYPKRVPWVTARILIGLSAAGYSMNDSCVRRGVEYLISQQTDGKWEAHTGGWNNVYETTSLCLEALIKCGVHCEMRVPKAISFLEDNSDIWMLEENEIDGTVSACQLAKIKGYQDDLVEYANKLVSRNINRIVDNERDLDYDFKQSCNTTQIAYYVTELCWYIFKKDLPTLLSDYNERSQETTEEQKMDRNKIFISYSEDSKSHIKKIQRIVDRLRSIGYDVLFYEDAPLGTNNMEFMERIAQCDAILVIGTENYKKKSTSIRTGGAWFEACVLAREFMNKNYNKIIPIAFDEFNDSFPEPFAINKGLRAKRIDDNFLAKLENELKHYFEKEN